MLRQIYIRGLLKSICQLLIFIAVFTAILCLGNQVHFFDSDHCGSILTISDESSFFLTVYFSTIMFSFIILPLNIIESLFAKKWSWILFMLVQILFWFLVCIEDYDSSPKTKSILILIGSTVIFTPTLIKSDSNYKNGQNK